MKMRRILANSALALLLAAGVILAAGCKKQPKCGCDGDELDSLARAHVYITYDAENSSARFTPTWSNYEIYYVCNPSAIMGELTQFEQGDEILISGSYFYECNYLMNSSNSYYSSIYRVYQIQVTDVEPYDYGR